MRPSPSPTSSSTRSGEWAPRAPSSSRATRSLPPEPNPSAGRRSRTPGSAWSRRKSGSSMRWLSASKNVRPFAYGIAVSPLHSWLGDSLRGRPLARDEPSGQTEPVIIDRLDVPVARFEQETGWLLKPEGACKGDVCVPLPDGAPSGGTVDVRVAAERLGMPVVADEDRGLFAGGPETIGGRALGTGTAPGLTLPTIDGEE